MLLSDVDDRARYLTLLDRLVADPDLPQPLPEQVEMVGRIRAVLGVLNPPAVAQRVPVAANRAAAPKKATAPKKQPSLMR